MQQNKSKANEHYIQCTQEQRHTKAEKQHSIEQYLAETQGDDSNQAAAPQPSGEGDVRVHLSAVPMASNMLAQENSVLNV